MCKRLRRLILPRSVPREEASLCSLDLKCRSSSKISVWGRKGGKGGAGSEHLTHISCTVGRVAFKDGRRIVQHSIRKSTLSASSGQESEQCSVRGAAEPCMRQWPNQKGSLISYACSYCMN